MLEVKISAKEQLIKLFHTYDPEWITSQDNQKLVLQQENYEEVFPMVDQFNGIKTYIE